MSVERLFDFIFGDNDFLVAYRASRRIKGFINCSNLSFSILFFIDYQASEWQVNEETGQRERLLTYKVTVSAVFGSTTICSNERQVNKYFSFFYVNYLINRLLSVNYLNHII
jgi:hypothetical protein